jgi:uncharacterized protein (DUF849 family)
MYYTDDSLLPENQDPLIITAAPYGPIWMPADYPEDIPVSWDEQVQKAVDCYNAGATMLHIHVRDPKTGHISKNFKEYGDLVGRLRQAVPKMVLQVGGSISFAPEGDEKAKWPILRRALPRSYSRYRRDLKTRSATMPISRTARGSMGAILGISPFCRVCRW